MRWIFIEKNIKYNMKKNELEIIKEGKTGHGILIENDGYLFLSPTSKEKQIKEGLEDNEWYVPNPFIVDCVLQKYGIKNANGRIYPEEVLKREVEKYQKMVDERMALGECYKPNAEVWTKNGWKTLEDIDDDDEILTMDVNTLEYSYQKILRKIVKDFDGELITIISNTEHLYFDYGINDLVTPKHKFPIFENINGYFKFSKDVEAENLNTIKGYIPTSLHPLNHSFKNEEGRELDFINIDDLKFGTEYYKGKVACIEVPNHTFYVKCNGKSHWTKNCNHPSESTIDLSRISHNIIEMHWEGRTLVGKLELNTTEGFRRMGIVSSRGDEVANLLINGFKIGVSSRGVGSVEQKLGQYVVGDDFELISWDVVATPSTPGAYIGTKEELQQYVETNTSNNVKPMINEKIKKIKNILNS